MGDSLKKERQHFDESVLVRIAQKPLLVAVIFLFTAFLPWTLCRIVPVMIKSLQSASLQDLIQWLSVPLLFALVNFSIFYLWMNSSGRNSAAHSRSIDLQDFKQFQAEIVPDAGDLGDFDTSNLHKNLDADRHSKASNHEQEHIFENGAVKSQNSDTKIPDFEIEQVPPVHAAFEIEEAPPVHVEKVPDEFLENVSIVKKLSTKGHHKSRSMTMKSKGLRIDLPSPIEEPKGGSSRPTRRNSSPKSKTPGASSGSKRNLEFDIDPKILETLDTSRHVSRRNSSPKCQEEDHLSHQPEHFSKSSSAASFVYTPPIREPIPLDKDDLNDRIDNFLTKFKMQRQESNLRALISS